MRRQIRFFILLAAGMLLLPAGLLCRTGSGAPDSSGGALPAAPPADTCYRVLRTESGTVEEIPLRDYLIGAVGAEMPASYEPEALKAQAVVSHTYAERMHRLHSVRPDPALSGADFSDDCRHYQAFVSAEQLRARYGDAFDAQYAKLAEAVDAVGGLLLCEDGEPIVAAFHAVSSGMTESAENVWGTALPYLVAVRSDADRSAPQFAAETALPADQVRHALLAAEGTCTLPEDDPAAWFSDAVRSESGTVLQIGCGGAVLSGERLREILGLRSACFTVSFADGIFTFRTKGSGHGVGMSQYGANAMAAQGSSFETILQHYYPETVLSDASEP
ncbi:MAG: stage II sporulation protein D [Oscillospiraceae bacterium]|nr:stage II sporulation protein D [Oscillospiraceae bacterium]